MNSSLIKYKGIHPGIILERELQKRGLKKRPFALAVGAYPQTFNEITKGRRNIPIPLALKIEKELQLEEGTIVILQSYYGISKEKEKAINHTPNLSIIRKSLFWDADINEIQWQKQYQAVIQRVSDRGNEEEKNEIARFYGKELIDKALKAKKTQPMHLYQIP